MRYSVTFKDLSEFSLYGEEYFADKAIFWRVHQTHLISFRLYICKKGYPIQVHDELNNELKSFKEPIEFIEWFKKHQSPNTDFGFGELDNSDEIVVAIKHRLKRILDWHKRELNDLSSKKFDAWRLDGGYKELELITQLGLASFQVLEQKNEIIPKSPEYIKLKNGIALPLESKINSINIINYSKQAQDKLNKERLIEFCKQNISLLEPLINETITHAIRNKGFLTRLKDWFS